MRFQVFTYGQGTNPLVWEGTPSDDTAPIAFIPDMNEYGPRMALGDRLILGPWHYAIKVADN